MGHLAKTATASADRDSSPQASANFAAVVEPHLRVFAFGDSNPAFVLFIDK